MTLTETRPLPTADEAIRMALARVEMATLRLCLLGDVLTPEQRHPIQGDLAAVKAVLLTPPLRPEEVG